jgi:ribulose bisphosphate carboxylase small subunit
VQFDGWPKYDTAHWTQSEKAGARTRKQRLATISECISMYCCQNYVHSYSNIFAVEAVILHNVS